MRDGIKCQEETGVVDTMFLGRWWRLISDVAVLSVLGALLIFLEVGGERGLYVKRGFFCDDETLRFPYTSRPAVPTWLLVLGSFFIPFVSILLGNLYERCCRTRPDTKRAVKLFASCSVPPWLVRAFYHVRWLIIGVLLAAVVTDILKVTVGRLRPHFFSVCRPDFDRINCTDAFGHYVYVTDYECMGRGDIADSDRVLHDSHLSFPSGHASSSTYSFVFLLIYLASVRTFYHRSALKLFLMLVSFSLAVLTSVSRISDNRHHPADVLAGMAIGAVVAVIICYYFLSFFGHHNQHKSEKSVEMKKEEPLNSNIHH